MFEDAATLTLFDTIYFGIYCLDNCKCCPLLWRAQTTTDDDSLLASAGYVMGLGARLLQ